MSAAEAVPALLESGDRLTREEFHRRYCARPDIQKAELIRGVVYVSSPARADLHGEPQGVVAIWLGSYAIRRPGARMMVGASVFLGDDGEVQPDVLLVYDPPPPGGARLRDDHYLEGPPQLVVEVAASSASYDLHDKLELYREAGVPEYVVWQVIDKRITWFRLRNGEYVPVEPDARGVIESEAFPGLRLDVAKMLVGDIAGVVDALSAERRGKAGGDSASSG